jgi:HAD superfamily hydrolase (TIGR01509 family)
MSAVLFGSISTVADTSELQRQAFNQAFETHGLGWRWDRDDYLAMLETSGGQARIDGYAQSQGQTVDAAEIHRTKSRIFQESLASAQLAARPGVLEAIGEAKGQGLKVGLVTTTSRENITALIGALSPDLSSGDFDVIVDAASAGRPKPDGAAYAFALESLGEEHGDCVAIEDNVDGVRAAKAAGLACVAFPNENTARHDFAAADRRVDRVDLSELQQLTETGGRK